MPIKVKKINVDTPLDTKLSNGVKKKKTAPAKVAVVKKRAPKKVVAKTAPKITESLEAKGLPPIVTVEELFLPTVERRTWIDVLHDGRVTKTATIILNRVVLISSIAVYVIAFVLAGMTTFAANNQVEPIGPGKDQLKAAGGSAGYGTMATDIGVIVAKFLQFFFGALGLMFACYVFYGGFMWVTAAGDEKKVGTARGIIFHSIIGLIVCAASFTIANFWVGAIGAAVQ